MVLRSRAERARNEVMSSVATAWQTANLTRANRLPALATLLAPYRPVTKVDLEQAAVDHARILAMAEAPPVTDAEPD